MAGASAGSIGNGLAALLAARQIPNQYLASCHFVGAEQPDARCADPIGIGHGAFQLGRGEQELDASALFAQSPRELDRSRTLGLAEREDDIVDLARQADFMLPRQLGTNRWHISDELNRIILKTMAANPADRYPTVEALNTDVDALVDQGVIGNESQVSAQ